MADISTDDGGRILGLRPGWWVVILLAFGIFTRGVRFFLRFPLWEDECFLVFNLLNRSYAELFEPLVHHQVAPPLFLVVEKAMADLFGFSEWSLRLAPFVLSVASVFMFNYLSGRLLRGRGHLAALAVFAAAYPGIRYAAEAKQYAFDLFAALGLLCLLAAWWTGGRRGIWLWCLVLAAPIAVGLSYPAVFVGGGLSLVLGCHLAGGFLGRRRQAQGGVSTSEGGGRWPKMAELAPWICLNLTLLAGFAAVYFLAASHQSAAEIEFMSDFWQRAFPPWRRPWMLPWWLLDVHAGDMMAWPVGGARGASSATFILAMLGLLSLSVKRRWFTVGLCLAPAAIHLVAAALERYPYGGHMKFSMHLGAAVCLLGGAGVVALAARLDSRFPRRHGLFMAVFLLGMLAVGLGSVVRDVNHPYKTRSDDRARGFARWFWLEASLDGPVFDVERDLGVILAPEVHRVLSWAVMFVCNRAIYDPVGYRPPPSGPLGGDGVPDVREGFFRCVVYIDEGHPPDEGILESWLAAMGGRYELLAAEDFPMTRYDKRERRIVRRDRLRIFKFASRPPPPANIQDNFGNHGNGVD